MATPKLAPELQRSARLKLHRPIAVIDLETTGTSVAADRIVEIGILKITPDGEMHRFRKRVKPGIRIPKEATRVHGITNEDVASRPPFKTIARDVRKFVRNCDLVGFNLKSFDLPMLQAEFTRAGISFACNDRHVIDVKEIYHFHESRTLCDAVRFYCNAEHEERAHSALEDAYATWRVLDAQIRKYSLPVSVQKLAEFMERARPSRFLDSGRWFSMRDSRAVFAKGKYSGISLSRIAREDAEYLEWILGLADVPEDTKRMIRKKLD